MAGLEGKHSTMHQASSKLHEGCLQEKEMELVDYLFDHTDWSFMSESLGLNSRAVHRKTNQTKKGNLGETK